jgi:predicted nucleic acid-binding protein
VVLPAFFPETLDGVDLSKRADRLVSAIASSEVIAFAPDQLLHEFTKRSRDWLSTRQGSRAADPEFVETQVSLFFEVLLPKIQWVAAPAIALQSWELMSRHNLAPPDSLYLACAQLYTAELWISHDQADGFARHARAVYREVYLLSDTDFDSV